MPQPVVDRVAAAQALGLRVLKSVPRIGRETYRDPAGDHFLSNGAGEALSQWHATAIDLARAIEARGVGFPQLQAIGEKLAMSNPGKNWFESLQGTSTIHTQRAIERAFGEWADGDAIAAHIAASCELERRLWGNGVANQHFDA